jgi:putative SOS response-associated peptidase YedK
MRAQTTPSGPLELARHETDCHRSFLTTDPNAVVAPIHAKAMPVILTQSDEIEEWLKAPIGEALRLQRSLPDDALRIVARGAREDGALDAVPAA